MDLTNLFRACVKTVRTRNKALGPSVVQSSIDNDTKNLILGNTAGKLVKSEFAIKAKEIVLSITKMKEFLLRHRKDYINMNFIMYEASNMTENERDQIDQDSQKFMHTCKDVLRKMKKEIRRLNLTNQHLSHQEAVIDILEAYLKAVCNIFSEIKAIRVKRTIDKQKMVRLETGYRASKSAKEEEQTPEIEGKGSVKVNGTSDSNEENEFEDASSSTTNEISNEPNASPTHQDRINFGVDDPNENWETTTTTNFSPEELQLFEQENERLYEELNSMVDEVKQIEGRVIEISRLQEVFSEKVLEQEVDINKVADVTVGTTENIKEANEELRQAMKKNAGFRLWILFILVVLSFTVLFLNWYNP